MAGDAVSRPLRVVIADDEPPALGNLRALIARDAALELVAECGSGAEVVEVVRRERPDLLLIDVQMPEIDGFDAVEQLGTEVPPAVVFVTAYDQYAVRAFDAGALDYLLKPFDDARFAQALARVRARLGPSDAARAHRLAVRSGRQVTLLDVADIDWVGAADYCVELHVGSRVHLLRRSMGAVESEFSALGFCRVHRSAIVNLARVRALEVGTDGESQVVLADGARLPLSKRHRARLQQRLGLMEG
jgi:two-component system LytT family response regulator